MRSEKHEIFAEILHGYAVHEQTRQGYIALIKVVTSLMVLGTAGLVGLLEMPDMRTGFPLSAIEAAVAFAFLIMIAMAGVKSQFGGLVLRFRQGGRLQPHWEFMLPKRWKPLKHPSPRQR